jgi:lipopolysaccharide export system permease protein
LNLKILDLYIAKKFLVTVMFMFGITTVISVIFDISEKMSEFLSRNIPFHAIVFDYYINFIPNIINLLSPIIIFLSALYFTSRLANNTEILAVLSSGTSYYRILRPYIGVAILIALIDVGMKNFIIPLSYSRQIRFEYTYIDQAYKYSAMNVHMQFDKNAYFYAQSVDNANNRAADFTIEKFSGGQLVYKLRSDEAFYDVKAKDWNVKHYYIRTINGMHETLQKGDSMRVKTGSITIDDFGHKVKSMPSMTTPELNTYIENAKLKGDQDLNFYLVEKYRRFSMPVDIIVLVLIAVSLATRKVRGGLGMHLITGILIALTQVMFVRFSTTFATNGSLPPQMAVFMPTFIYGLLAVYLVRTTPK